MTVRYLLNDAIEFDPVNGTLSAQKNAIVVSLNAPVSRCLQLLIEERHHTIPQQDFYPFVWGDTGNAVSVNTLYQNIALLRKALKMFDEQGNQFVVTVPRLGFALSPQVIVSEVMQAEEPEAESSPPVIVPTEAEDNDKRLVPTPAPPINAKDSAPGMRMWWQKALLPAITALLFAFMCIQIAQWGLPHIAASKSIYTSLPAVSECKVFARDAAVSPGTIEKIVSDKLIDCHQTPWVYLMSSQEGIHMAFLTCRSPLESVSSPGCLTLSLWGTIQ